MDTRGQSHRLIVATYGVIGQKLYGHSVVGLQTKYACKIFAKAGAAVTVQLPVKECMLANLSDPVGEMQQIIHSLPINVCILGGDEPKGH